jgi:glycosyltransferase involved in cell wall biosynthesis
VTGCTSVIIPCYNGQAYLPEALDSVRLQTRPAGEIIVVDDGSTEPIRLPENWQGPPLRLLRTHNRGLPAARNLGIAEATGDFVALLDCDDAWQSEKLAMQEEALLAEPNAVLAFTQIAARSDWLPFTSPAYPCPSASHEEMLRALWQRNFITPSSVIVRRAALRRAGGFDESMRYCEDWELWGRLLALGNFVQVAAPLCWYRKHAGQMTKQAEAMAIYRRRARQKFRALLGDALAEIGISYQQQEELAREEYRLDCMFPFYVRQLGAARRLLWSYLLRIGFDAQVFKCAMLSLLPRMMLNRVSSELAAP